MRPDRLLRYLPWLLGTSVLLLSVITQDTTLPVFYGWNASRVTLNIAAGCLAVLSAIAAYYATRTTWPILVMAVIGWSAAGMWPAIVVTSFCVGLRYRRSLRIIYFTIAALFAGVPVYIAAIRNDWPAVGAVYLAMAVAGVLAGFPMLLGMLYATRSEMMLNLTDRAVSAEQDQEMRTERARTNERSAIAREMHDIVAHRVALIVLHAGAMEMGAPDPETTKRAALIRSLGRQAMTELRQMLGALRTDQAAALAPQPTAADLDRLVEQTRDAGLPVALRRNGSTRELPAATELTIYRVVQEALTNVAKHAGTPATAVTLDYGENQVSIIVDNDPPAGPPLGMPVSGLGLIGLSERVCLMNGTLNTGPRPNGGWRLHATLPI